MTLLMITVDGLNETQLAQIQRVVENSADDWWHRQSNVWIVVTSDSTRDWRGRFTPIVHEPPGSVLVVRIDPSTGWAGRRAGGIAQLGAEWLNQYLSPHSRHGE